MALEGEQLPDINRYPILNQQKAAQIFEATFQKDCGNDDLCESDLKLQARLDLPGNYRGDDNNERGMI